MKFYTTLSWITMWVPITAAVSAMSISFPVSVPIEVARARYERLEKSSLLPSYEKKNFALLKVLQEIPIENLEVADQRQVEAGDFGPSIRSAIEKHANRVRNWEGSLSSSAISKISSQVPLLEETFGARSLTMAWFHYKMGEQKEAKGILLELHARTFEWGMKLKSVPYRGPLGPLEKAETQVRALEPMCTEEEYKTIKAQLQKIKIHVSNLPESKIVT